MWLPGNDHTAETGTPDDRDAILAYLRRITAGREPDPELLEVFVDTAPVMLRYLEEHTPLEVHVCPLVDYYATWDVPGRRPLPGRTVEANPYAVGTELPEWKDRLVSRGTLMSLGAATTLAEDFAPQTPELVAELARREAEDVRPKGAALIARLFKGLLERGVTTLMNAPAGELVVRDGVVVGIIAEHEGRTLRIGTRRGVVLACGGFEWNADLVRAHIGYDVRPLSPIDNNTGDGLTMAVAAGAQLGNMTSYYGTPAMFDPEVTRENGELIPQFEWSRGAPASLIVNAHGRRFANESLPYNDFPKAFGTYDTVAADFPNAGPAYQIFDASVREKQRVLSMHPGEPDPEWVHKADDIGSLADLIGIDREALEATVARFNEYAAKGEDPDFERDRRGLMVPGRVAPLVKGPFYAVGIHPGTLGTNGGPRINRDGQVLRQGGGVVEGLYAAGNTAAGTFGWSYPSGGATIGNGTVFGYLAGRHVAAVTPREV